MQAMNAGAGGAQNAFQRSPGLSSILTTEAMQSLIENNPDTHAALIEQLPEG